MSAECDALMQKLNAIDAKLSAMDGKYIPKADRDKIVSEGASRGKDLAKAAIVPIFGAYTLKTIHDSDFRAALMRAENALSTASTAKGIAVGSKQEALAASRKAKQALAEAAESYLKSVDAQQLANRAYAVGKGAEFEAAKAKILASVADTKAGSAASLASRAKGVAETAKVSADVAASKAKQALIKIDEVVARFSRLIDDVAAKAGKALGLALDSIGVSKAAQASAGKALGVALKALGKIFLILDILSTIFSILNAIDLRRRMNILEQKISIIEREISKILGMLFGIVSRLKNVQGMAEYAQLIARNAVQLGNQATNIAVSARSVATAALTQAAIATAQVAAVGALATAANASAKAAQSTATQALTRAKVPGPRGLQGLQGKQGLRGAVGLKGAQGLRGVAGARGKNGINGIGVTNIKPVVIVQRITTPGKTVTLVRNNTVLINRGGMKATDLALLKKIDATTTRTAGVQAGHVATSLTTNAVVVESRAFLATMQAFAAKAWQSTRLGKVLELLTFVGVMHNVSMLSRNVGETFLEVVGQGIQAVGIRDETNQVIDVNEVVSSNVEGLLKNVLGVETYAGVSEAWNKANRIISSASAVIWSIRSISDAGQDLMEWVGENTGRMGNALKRWRVVGENAYPDMSERPQAHHRLRTRFSKAGELLDNTEDRLSVFGQATSSVIELQDELGESGQNFGRFKDSVVAGIPDPWVDNIPVFESNAQDKADSLAPNIEVSDSQKG